MKVGAELPGWHEVALRVRFHEVDTYGYFWHGHALAHFECLRMDLARPFGLSTTELFREGVMLPMLEARCIWRLPCFDDERILLQGSLLRSAVANPFMSFVYRGVKGATGETAFLGYTRQVFARRDGRAVTRVPDAIRERLVRLAEHLAARPAWPDAADLLRELGVAAAVRQPHAARPAALELR